MKKIAYIIYSENHKSAFAKGFLNKSRHILSQTVQGLIPPWKASNFYDDRLNDLGIIIAVGKFDRNDETALQAIWKQIFDLCTKYNIGTICAAEIDVPESTPVAIFQDKTILFVYKLTQGYQINKINRNSHVAILLSEDTDMRHIKYLSDKQNYIYLYHKNRKIANRFAEEIYHYNGTAAQVTDNIGTLKNCDAIILFDDKMQKTINYLPKHIYIIDVNIMAASEKIKLETKVFTNKLGEMQLSAGFIECLYYADNLISPIDDMISIEKLAESMM